MIVANTVSFNDYGIYLRFSDNNEITENTLNNNYIGIYLYYYYNNEITDNIFNGNTQDIREFSDTYPSFPPEFSIQIGIIIIFVIIIISACAFISNKKKTTRRTERRYKREYTVSTSTPQVRVKEIKTMPSPSRKLEEESIKKCPHCGQRLYIEAIYCFKCGKKAEEDQKISLVSVTKEEKIVAEKPDLRVEKILESPLIKEEKEDQPFPPISDLKEDKSKATQQFCEFCGMKLGEMATFCPQCGSRIKSN